MYQSKSACFHSHFELLDWLFSSTLNHFVFFVGHFICIYLLIHFFRLTSSFFRTNEVFGIGFAILGFRLSTDGERLQKFSTPCCPRRFVLTSIHCPYRANKKSRRVLRVICRGSQSCPFNTLRSNW
jgi:hypothetical protein